MKPFQMRYLVVHFDQKSCYYLCAYHISKTNFIQQPHEQKCCRRQTQWSSTLCGCFCTCLIWCCPMEPFQMRYLVVHFDQKSCFICVPTTLARQILFSNHRNKKVVGGNYNVLVLYADASASDPAGVVLFNTFKWYILWFILIKNLVVCVPAMISKWISFRNQRNKKVVGGNYNVLVHYADASATNPEGVVFCNTFKWDILFCVHILNP